MRRNDDTRSRPVRPERRFYPRTQYLLGPLRSHDTEVVQDGFRVTEGSFAQTNDDGFALAILQLVVPNGWSSNLDRIYTSASLDGYVRPHRTMVTDEPQGVATFAISQAQKCAEIWIQWEAPLRSSTKLILDLRDPDWRRMLRRIRIQAQKGAACYLMLFPNMEDVEKSGTALKTQDVGTFMSIGAAVPLSNTGCLKRLEQIESLLTDDEWQFTGHSTDPISVHFRDEYPLAIPLEPGQAGGLAFTVNQFPALLIDTGHEDQLMVEATVRTLVNNGFTRPSSLEHPWPREKNLFAILAPHHISVLRMKKFLDMTELQTIYSGPTGASREWVSAIRRQRGVPIIITSLRGQVLTGSSFEHALTDAVLFQTAAVASATVLDFEEDVLRDVLPAAGGDPAVADILSSVLARTSLALLEGQALREAAAEET